jgi:hypothetical protein
MITVAAAVTNGTASNPRVTDDNAGKQLSTRVEVSPAAGLVVGSSFSRGNFLDRGVAAQVSGATNRGFDQRAHGLDVEYSRDHWLVRGDAVLSRWHVPFIETSFDPVTLDAFAASLEGRYSILPGMYAAVRAEHLTFSRIAGASGRLAWDAPVTRVEVGGGYYLQRNLIVRVSLQINERDAGRVTSSQLLATQLLYWF